MTEIRRLKIAAVRCVPRRRSPERGGIDDDPQILHYLGRYEVGIPGMDDNRDKVGGQAEEPRGETLERKTEPARCRGIDAYGYPENGV